MPGPASICDDRKRNRIREILPGGESAWNPARSHLALLTSFADEGLDPLDRGARDGEGQSASALLILLEGGGEYQRRECKGRESASNLQKAEDINRARQVLVNGCSRIWRAQPGFQNRLPSATQCIL